MGNGAPVNSFNGYAQQHSPYQGNYHIPPQGNYYAPPHDEDTQILNNPPAQGGANLLGRHRHGGGTEGGDALGHQMTRHFADRLFLAITGIRPDTAVNMHIHKARRHDLAGPGQHGQSRRASGQLHRRQRRRQDA